MTRSSTPGPAAAPPAAAATGLTATTPRQLMEYRSVHKIRPVLEWDPDRGRTFQVCAVDRIRLYTRGSGFAHDSGEIKQLAAFERGEKIDWTIR